MSHRVERTILLHARPATVWAIFSETPRFARWWGEGSKIDAREGGAVRIRYPDGSTATGKVLALESDRSLTFSFGYDDPSKGLAPGGSTVQLTAREYPEGTLVELGHEVPSITTRDLHEPGWRYQLGLLAKVAHEDAHAEREAMVERWFGAWNTIDVQVRRRELEAVCADEVRFADGHAYVRGHADLLAHLAAVKRHMAGVELFAAGGLRYMQGIALVDWEARRGGKVLLAGTNVFEFAADGRILRVTGVPG
ncbi:MAG: hypothetical protein HC927_07415 [Deltaproteobacteria bacterium]|nr:hypothetical protein [Deltaproteobacteria bacterium]